MKRISINPHDLLPGILLDRESGKFKIYGKSCPVNVTEFYSPVFEWIEEYLKDPLDKTVLEFYMLYFNTASAKIFLKLITLVEELIDMDKELEIRWFYNESDEDILEAGQQFDNIKKVKIKFIPVESNEDDDEEEFNNIINDILK